MKNQDSFLQAEGMRISGFGSVGFRGMAMAPVIRLTLVFNDLKFFHSLVIPAFGAIDSFCRGGSRFMILAGDFLLRRKPVMVFMCGSMWVKNFL
jgi:hypothetical protein